MGTTFLPEKKGHICPPSNAKHPSDRWESMFVYSFMCKFTHLRGKIEGLETPMDLENALIGREPNPIFSKVLTGFVLNLRPQTRNLSEDQISSTVASVLSDHLKTSERTVFWNDELRMNINPFDSLEGSVFTADWDLKLKVLRVLVEMQLSHQPEVKDIIDRAWGVVHQKQKKKESITAPSDSGDSHTIEQLQQVPIGQDRERKRYWVVDDSPRIYISTNPWKVTATFESISSTKEEYLGVIERLKGTLPPTPSKGSKRKSKHETNHEALIKALEDRLGTIDVELARVQRVRRKIEARNALLAQAEVRETRTRRQTRRPDYVYQQIDSEDDGDEYKYQADDDIDDEYDGDEFLDSASNELNGSRSRRGASLPETRRRSARTASQNANGKRMSPVEPSMEWRGERRSTRLGAPPETQLDVVSGPKRSRTDESSGSTGSAEGPPAASSANPGKTGIKLKINGAAAVKPTERVVEQIAGKKKSKFWVYAIEPIPETSSAGNDGTEAESPRLNGDAQDGNHSALSSPQLDREGSSFSHSPSADLS